MREALEVEQRLRAVIERDAAFDGRFYYGVPTTKIYCRPSCPSRRPNSGNVLFFDTPEAAESAGYRSCQRCKPTEIDAHQQAVLHMQRLLDTVEPTPSLAQLARAVGLSPFHVQRLFKASVGVSPKQYAIAKRTERTKQHLHEAKNVTTALYNAGHASPRTLYDPATDQLGMTPGQYKAGGAGQLITFTVVESALGPMLVAATTRGLVAVRFGDPEALEREVRSEYPKATFVNDATPLKVYVAALRQHLAGRRHDLALPSDVPSTDFQRRVWAALKAIPYGETRSYAQVAEMIGEPTAVRAVARACAANPIALVVPCHRVVRSGGQLSGYRWGVERKRALLDGEKAGAAD